MKDEDILIFLNKANSSHWAKDYPDEVLPFDEYYKVLFKPSKTIKKFTGYFEKTNTTNKILIYKNLNNQYLAQVASYKKFEHHKYIYTKNQTLPTVTVATYLNRFDRIILLNHFDAIGRNHSNDYSIYPLEVQPLYEKYFTDNIVEQNGQTFYHSNCPHFHFNTALQTTAFGNQEHINAISIKQLLVYLNDLNSCQNENDILLTEDLGMPFLNYKQEKFKYISIVEDIANKVLNLSNSAHCEEVFQYMNKIKHLLTIRKPENNIEKIMLDLQILNKVIKKFPDNLELVAIFSNAFVKSVNYKAVEKEFYKSNN